jgi:YebC/PmpR family DNA-binding regulatory protein
MSGHSKWATIKRAKGKADAARGRLFNRLIREITIAARTGGGDREANPRLRSAIATAKSSNMPAKNIDTAIKKGTGEIEGVAYEEMTLEAYGPGGVAILVESTTDNRNRTIAEVRHAVTKAGGNLGSANSVSWMFHAKGQFIIPRGSVDEESLLELVLEAGAEDLQTEEDDYIVFTPYDQFEAVRSALEKVGIKPSSAELTKIPENTIRVESDTALKVLKLIDALDELDDTQHVYTNADIDDAALEKYNS